MNKIWLLTAVLALTGCGPRHFSESLSGASGSPTTVMDGGAGSVDGGGTGGNGLGGTTGGNPIVHELAMSVDANASLILNGFLGSCGFIDIETIGPDLVTGRMKLRLSGFDAFCSPNLFTSGVINSSVRFQLARGRLGTTVDLENSIGQFSSSDKIDFTVSGTGVLVKDPVNSRNAVEYTVDFLPALVRLQSVGAPGRSGTPAQQIDSDIGGTSMNDAVYCTVQAAAERKCRPSP